MFSGMGSLLSFFLFAGQIPLMRRLIKEKDSSKYSLVPSFGTMATCLMWAPYAHFFMHDSWLVFLNTLGIVPFCLGYLTIMIWYHPSRPARIKSSGFILFEFAFTAALYSLVLNTPALADNARMIAGVTADVINISIFASPCSAIYRAYKELDPSRVPVLFTVVGLLCALNWGVFGLIVGDPFLTTPNAIGFCLSGAQLIVIAVIRRKRAKLGPRVKMEDDKAGGKTEVNASSGDVEKGKDPVSIKEGAKVKTDAAVDDHEYVGMSATVPPVAIMRQNSNRREYAYSWNPPDDTADLQPPSASGTGVRVPNAGAIGAMPTITSSHKLLSPSESTATLDTMSSMTALGLLTSDKAGGGNGLSISSAGHNDGDAHHHHDALSMDAASAHEVEHIVRTVARHVSFRAASGAKPHVKDVAADMAAAAAVAAAAGGGTPVGGPTASAGARIPGLAGMATPKLTAATPTPKAE